MYRLHPYAWRGLCRSTLKEVVGAEEVERLVRLIRPRLYRRLVVARVGKPDDYARFARYVDTVEFSDPARLADLES